MRGEDGERLPGGYRRASDRRHMRLANDLSLIESSAELLYGLIHQRYITSRPGIQQMADKYELQHFGFCPRVFCNQARVLPVGCSDIPGQETEKLFGCLFFMTFPEFDISTKGDPLNLASISPAFGQSASGIAVVEVPKSASSSLTSTPIHSTANPDISSESTAPPSQPLMLNGTTTTNIAPGLGPGKFHEPRIYGFRVSERAKTGPRMTWLRMRPADMNELDETAAWHELYGEESEEESPEGTPTNYEQQQQVARRKKAPIRARRRPVHGADEGTDVGMNGMGEVG